jgi:hypothetical protein
VLGAGDAGRLQLHQGIARPEALDDLALQGGAPVAGTHEQVAVAGWVAQGMEQGVAATSAGRARERSSRRHPCCASSQRSASIDAMQPLPAAVTACR